MPSKRRFKQTPIRACRPELEMNKQRKFKMQSEMRVSGRLIWAVVMLALIVVLTLRSEAGESALELLEEDPSLTTLAAAISAAGLADRLDSDTALTLLAPSNRAFEALGQSTLNDLLKPSNREKLRTILLNHVIAGKASASDVARMTIVTPLSGQVVKVTRSGSGLTLNDARVIRANITAESSIVHVIDRVLVPETRNVLEVLKADGRFTTLIQAVQSAGLESELSERASRTLFAPTDDAFSMLPDGALGSLLRLENRKELTSVLASHLVADRINSSQLASSEEVTTFNDLVFSRSANSALQLTVGGTAVSETDMNASNGLIHVISSVIDPEQNIGGEQETSDAVRQVLTHAINRGVHHFNRGNHAACAHIYETSAMSLLMTNPACLTQSHKNILQSGLARMQQSHNPTSQAWAMRMAFDKILTK